MIKRIYLEITNSCNLNCPFCEANKKNDIMCLDDVKRNLDEIKKITNYVYLHILGEPLSHPFFNDILDYCDKLTLNIQLVTNGTLLHKYPDIFKHPSLRKLSISIHSIDNLNIDNSYFKTINRLLNTSRNENQYLELRFYDLPNLKAKAKKYYDYLKENYALSNTTKIGSYKINDNSYLYIQDLFHWPNINDKYISNHGKCLGAINMLGILCNGDVVMCCLDPSGHTKIGNIYDNKLIDILNSKEYLNIIDNLKKGILISPLCQRCTYRLRFDK